MWTHRKEPPLPATDSGPKPGDFPVRSLESRAAARTMLEREDEVSGMQIIDLGCSRQRSDKPIGQAMVAGELVAVYGDGGLGKKTGTDALPWVRVPRAELTIFVRDLGSSTLHPPPSHSAKRTMV
jgi:hypothetical protein